MLLQWLALNICSRPQTSQTIDYVYTNWKDRLTEYDGQAITYDRIGNPLTYRDGMTMTWKRGRQLTTLQTAENSIQYKYDSDSIRTSKIVDGVVHTYEYLDGLLMHETRGTQAYDYYYDVNGQLYAVSYKLSENDTKKVYYFTHNWRGDIVGIYNGNGELKATYSYDAWGNVTAIEDSNGSAITEATDIANLNPFRYRGYYMDTETGLYYLMSRYYDPVTHRFVNADGYFQSGGDILDTNMNAYCRNNPVNCFDVNGFWVITYGGSANICLAWGLSVYLGVAIDEYGNFAIQFSRAGTSTETPYLGLLGYMGISETGSFMWEVDSIYDLQEQTTVNFGVDMGFETAFSGDLIFMPEAENLIGGVSISRGVGYGLDSHVYISETENLIIYDKKSNEYSFGNSKIKASGKKTNNTSTNKFCTYCGKPIGSNPWQCSGGWM